MSTRQETSTYLMPEYFNPDQHDGFFKWLDQDLLPYPVVISSISDQYGPIDKLSQPLGLYGHEWRIAIGRGKEEGKYIYYGFEDKVEALTAEHATATILADETDWTRSLRIAGMAGDHHIMTAQYRPFIHMESERQFSLDRVDLSMANNAAIRAIRSRMSHKDNPYAGIEGGPVHTYVHGDGLVFQEPAFRRIEDASQDEHKYDTTGIITPAMIRRISPMPEHRPGYMAVVYDRHALYRNGQLPTAKELAEFGYTVGHNHHLRIQHAELPLSVALPLVLR